MTPELQAEYIVQAIREGASMYEEDARKFLAEHDAHIHAESAAELTAVRAERDEARKQLAARTEDLAFMERATLPDLRRAVDHHKGGKERWRTRAEKAEATLAALHAAGVDNWEGYDEAVAS